MEESQAPLIGAIDQGTSSTRFLIFSGRTAQLITSDQIETKYITPKEGWVEMDPWEILEATKTCMQRAIDKLQTLGFEYTRIVAVGICNQRETTVAWDKLTGEPLYNAIIWLDQRAAALADELIAKTPGRNKDAFRNTCGLPVHPYFSALKMRWLMEEVPKVKKAVKHNTCLMGTIDSWLIWNLTRGEFVTDVTNASRTALLDLKTLTWDEDLCEFYGIPMEVLADVRSSSEIYGSFRDGPLKGVPISGCLGDQQAALVGQGCLRVGEAKNTYGTGCFLLYNTGLEPVFSRNGLLTTVAFKFGSDPPVYALEGSIAVAGAAVRWLRDSLQVIERSEDIEELASRVHDTHGVYFVPAFSGLYAPYWHPEARGIICGLSQHSNKAHVARALLEGISYQTREVLDAMKQDCGGGGLEKLKVTGGMSKNDLLIQLQADILGSDCVRAQVVESSALGAAIAAGSAKGIECWNPNLERTSQPPEVIFKPTMAFNEREQRYAIWKEAVKRSMNWTNVMAGKPVKPYEGSRVFPFFSHLSAFGVGLVAGICLFKYSRPN